jgi:hypothetical protein
LRNHADAQTAWLANYIYDSLEQDGADNSYFFVLCMSFLRDDLSQWLQPNIGLRPYLIPVRYDSADHDAIIDDVTKWTIEFFKQGLPARPDAQTKEWADSFAQKWREQIIGIAPALKNKAFKNEAEWRLVCSLSPGDIDKVEILQRSSLISRHLPLHFGDKLPIREVIVGPCRHPLVSHVSIDTYLRGRGYAVNAEGENDPNKVTISRSNIPFQVL